VEEGKPGSMLLLLGLKKGLEYMAFDLITAFYEGEDARIKDITTPMNALVDDQVLRRTEIMRDCDKYYYKPDGSINVRNFQDVMKLLPHFEVKNSTGEGGSDPIHQAWCDYAFTILQETYVFFLSTLQNVDCLVASAHLSGMLLSCI